MTQHLSSAPIPTHPPYQHALCIPHAVAAAAARGEPPRACSTAAVPTDPSQSVFVPLVVDAGALPLLLFCRSLCRESRMALRNWSCVRGNTEGMQKQLSTGEHWSEPCPSKSASLHKAAGACEHREHEPQKAGNLDLNVGWLP